MEPTYMKLELGRWDAQKEEEEGGERQKEEEWLLKKERGGETDTGSMWVKGRLWRGGGWERPHKHLLKNSKGTPGKGVAYVMYIFKTCFGILWRIMWTATLKQAAPTPKKNSYITCKISTIRKLDSTQWLNALGSELNPFSGGHLLQSTS